MPEPTPTPSAVGKLPPGGSGVPGVAGLDPAAARRAAEALVSAVAELASAPVLPDETFAPLGVPVRHGRLALARVRHLLTDPATPADPGEGDESVPVTVVAGFGTVAWLGPLTATAPPLGKLSHRTSAGLDARGRLRLDRRIRLWLRLPDPDRFDALLVPAPDGGVLVVPIHRLAQRWAVLAP